MAQYIDGFLLAISADKLEQYTQMATKAAAIWKEHGAIEVWECVSDDLDNVDMRPFRQAAGASDDELVIFSWISYPDKASRDRINAKVMADPRLQGNCEDIFDFTRMSWGGFRPIVQG